MRTSTTAGQTLIKQLAVLLILLSTLSGCSQPEEPTLALYLAVQRGDINQIERHITWGSDINELNKDGLRPLHVAADKGRYVVVKLLLTHGADANAKDGNGNTPIGAALLTGRTQIATLLKEKGALIDADKLLAQVTLNHVADRDVFSLLIRWGADLNHIMANGETPLSSAVSESDLKMVKLLIRNGANVNTSNQANHSPLKIAESTKNPDIIRTLLKNGAQTKSDQ